MTKVIDYTVAIMEEWNWCLPAHASWSHDRLERWKFCDLFCAETGAVMAQVHALLADEFDQVFEGLAELIRTETLERTVYTTLYSGLEHWWLTAAQPANWTPWCSYNNLATNLMLEKDPAKRVFATKEFLGATSRYINYCPADGYSPEGPSYYNKSNLMVFRTLYFLHKAMPGSMDKIWADPKIKTMVEFIVNLQMGPQHQLTFADSRPQLTPNLSFILPAGKIFDSQELLGLGINRIAELGTEGSHLKESLALLFDMPEKLPEKCPVGKPVSLFPNRLVILRSAGFTLSLKGGYNNEPHNHNDLGHFSIFNEGKPVIVDAGTGIYSRIHFSTARYTLWNTRGSGHNAPVFGQYEQVNGWNYTAQFELKDNTINCDLSKAYPAQAGVKSFERKLEFSDRKVTVEDNFVLEKPLPAVITLLCAVPPTVKDKNLIQLGNVTLKLENIAFDSTEAIPESEKIWGKPLTALRLKSDSTNYKLIFENDYTK